MTHLKKFSIFTPLLLLVGLLFLGVVAAQAPLLFEGDCDTWYVTPGPPDHILCYGPEEPTATATTVPPTPTATNTPNPTGRIVVDHTNYLDEFDRIPPEYLEAARNMTVMFSDRSVGDNINNYLDCWAMPSYDQALSRCKRGVTREEFDPGPEYDRSNWVFEYRGGSWYSLTQDFVTSLEPQYAHYDIATYQFSYLNVADYNDALLWFDCNNQYGWSICDVAGKNDIYWTTSLARTIGTQTSTEFNEAMRAYTAANNLPLFDFADIESHAPDGSLCLDPTGIWPAICSQYTSETSGGHLGSMSVGGIRVTKAFWVMMARMAGWQP